MKKQLGIFCMIGALLWMGLIFGFSDDSGKVSSKLSNNLLVTLKLIDKEELKHKYDNPDVKRLRVLIRKFAHLGLYTALGGLVLVALKGILVFQTLRAIGLTFLLTGFYAISDEIHQYFVPGRAARIEDVLIDLCGVAVGMAICLTLMALVRQIACLWAYLNNDSDSEGKGNSEISSVEMA